MKKLNYFILSVLFISFLSCNNTDHKQIDVTKKDEKMKTNNKADSIKRPTLKSLLDERKNNFAAKADEKTKTIYKEGIETVENSGIIDNAKQVGEKAPNFKLNNALGNTIVLDQYLKKGPVILTWYRGGWCPYCNLTLHQLQEELPNIQLYGANLIALTPELPDSSITTAEKHELKFEILSDIGNEIAKEYGVVFELTPEVAEVYNRKFNLSQYNGDDSNELPLAATYIISQEGTIVYAFLDADYRNRAEPSELVDILKSMKK